LRTPLYEKHIKLNGKMTDYSGWELPIQYTGIIEEHNQTRNGAGLFDVSHMGEISVTGSQAEQFIQKLVTNDILKMSDNQAMYSPMCYDNGGIVDDLLVYRIDSQNYLLVVNAANTLKDYEWIKNNLNENAEIIDVSAQYAQIALQGQKAQEILQTLTDFRLSDIGFFQFRTDVKISTIKAMISRTGYTGEDGFEIYINPSDAPALWKKLLDAGKEYGLVPVGLGARDTLRFEAALPLYGNEISQNISPLEAGLNRFVKLNKDSFIGKEALVKQQQEGLKRRLVGFEMIERGIPRGHYEVKKGEEEIGFVTTGYFSPTLKKAVGLALVKSEFSILGTEFDIVIKERFAKAMVVPMPFYRHK